MWLDQFQEDAVFGLSAAWAVIANDADDLVEQSRPLPTVGSGDLGLDPCAVGWVAGGEQASKRRLDTWMAAVDADDQPDLHSFASGLRRDYDAVRNGLTLPHNSGPVEGHVNRIKIK